MILGAYLLLVSMLQSGNVLRVVPPEKPAHSFSWDEASRRSSYVAPTLALTPSETTYAHDNDGLLLRMAPPGRLATFSYDLLGRPRTATDSAFRTVSFTYDLRGRPAALASSEGVTLTYGWDGSLLASVAVSGAFASAHSVDQTYDNFFRPLVQQVLDGMQHRQPKDEKVFKRRVPVHG